MYMKVKLDAYALHALFYGCSDSVSKSLDDPVPKG